MPNILQPPADLTQEQFFVILYDPDGEEYVLMLWDADGRKNTYNLGIAEKAVRYINRALPQPILLGERALDTARNFLAAQAIPAENRVFSIKDDRIDERAVARKMFQRPGQRDNILVESSEWDG